MLANVTKYNKEQTTFAPQNKILLNIGAPDVLPFTYIDTPGLKSNDPASKQFIEAEVARADIILVAHASGYDWDTCPPLDIALLRKVQNADVSIVAVVTKAEAAIQDSDISSRVSYLEGKRVIPAFVAAGTPESPIDVDEEEKFLRERYRKMPRNVILGAESLRNNLFKEYNKILMSRIPGILEAMTQVRTEISEQLNKVGKEPKKVETVKQDLIDIHNSFHSREGLYDVLVLIYNDIAAHIQPHLVKAVNECVDLMMNGLVKAFNDHTANGSPHRIAIATQLQPCLGEEARLLKDECTMTLSDKLHAKPASLKTYPHTAVHLKELYSTLEPKLDLILKDATTQQYKATYTHEEMKKVVSTLGLLLIVERPPDVWYCNVKNVATWYWELYQGDLVANSKREVEKMIGRFLDASQKKINQLDLTKIAPETKASSRLRKLFLETLDELDRIQDDIIEASL